MIDEIEQSGESDVAQESSSSPASESSEKGSNDNSDLSLSPENKPESKEQYVPYERFKELVEQKNQFAKKFEEMEKSNKEFKEKFESFGKTKEVSPEQKLVERLKGIDPEFGTWAEQQAAVKAELDQLKQWRAQAEHSNYVNAAKSSVDKLQSDLKVDPTFHQMFLAQIPMGTPLDQIPAKYKAMHDSVSKILETQKRDTLAQYSTAKKTDSKTPAPAKGKAPAPSKNAEKFSKNPEEAKLQLRKEMVNAIRSSRAN